MEEAIRFRFILILLISIVICMVIIEATGTQIYAYYAILGLAIYFSIAGVLLAIGYYVRRWNRKRYCNRILKKIEDNPPDFNNVQALGRVKRDINRLKPYNGK